MVRKQYVRPLVASVTIALLAVLSGTVPARAATAITVDPPGALTSGSTLVLTAHLTGASPKQVESGIRWNFSKPALSVNGWNARVGYGLPADTGSVKLQSDKGVLAVFTFTAEYNGHYRFSIGLGDSEDLGLDYATTVEIDVASPSLRSLPAPPSNPRVEITGQTSPVNSTVAHFQARLVADSSLIVPGQNGSDSTTTKVAIRGVLPLTTQVGAEATNWADGSERWIYSGTKPEVSITYGGSDLLVYYRNDLDFPIGYTASAIYAVYPPESALRCGYQGIQLTCQVGAYNEGYRNFAKAPSPPAVAYQLQFRTGTNSGKRSGPWKMLSTGSLSMNGDYATVTRALGRNVALGKSEVRLVILGYPKSAVMTKPLVGAVDKTNWRASNPAVLG